VALTGCDRLAELLARADAPDRLAVPALPIIQDAVRGMAPTFRGRRLPALADQLCALAQGRQTQQQTDERLRQLGLDPLSLPNGSGDALALLVNQDHAGQVGACAADQAAAVFLLPDPMELMKPLPAGQGAEAGSAQQWGIDQNATSRALALRVGQARANAETFGLIARRLMAMPGLSLSEYRNNARELFLQLAPAHLERIQRNMLAEQAIYQVSQLDGQRLFFTSGDGVRFELSGSDGRVLRQYGQLWYGRGVVMGSVPRLQVDLGRP
jgi:hypothetical protein